MPDGVPLGVDGDGRPVVLSDRQLSAHALIVGASGAGKSTTLLTIMTDHVRRGRPVVAIDMKGSPAFARELAGAAAAAGRPFQLWSLDGPSHWNPLAHGNATELKDKLIGTERFTEPHYQRAAERYVQTVLQVLEHTHPGRPPTLDEVVADDGPPPAAERRARASGAAGRAGHGLSRGLTGDQVSAIRGLVRAWRSSPSRTPPRSCHRRRTGRAAEVDLHRALSGGEVVLLSLNSGRYGKLAAQLGTLAVQDLVCAAGERLAERGGRGASAGDRGDRRVLGARIRPRDATNRARPRARRGRRARHPGAGRSGPGGAGVARPGARHRAVKIAHRQDVPASADAFAQMVGTVRVWEETHRIGGSAFARYDTGRGTRREVERFALHPNVIKELRTGEAVVITKQPAARARTVRVGPPRREGPELG